VRSHSFSFKFSPSLAHYGKNQPLKIPPSIYASHYIKFSSLDDPLVWGILSARPYLDSHLTRWSLGASDIVFTNPVFSGFFQYGQVIETFRGAAVYQPAVDTAIERPRTDSEVWRNRDKIQNGRCASFQGVRSCGCRASNGNDGDTSTSRDHPMWLTSAPDVPLRTTKR